MQAVVGKLTLSYETAAVLMHRHGKDSGACEVAFVPVTFAQRYLSRIGWGDYRYRSRVEYIITKK